MKTTRLYFISVFTLLGLALTGCSSGEDAVQTKVKALELHAVDLKKQLNSKSLELDEVKKQQGVLRSMFKDSDEAVIIKEEVELLSKQVKDIESEIKSLQKDNKDNRGALFYLGVGVVAIFALIVLGYAVGLVAVPVVFILFLIFFGYFVSVVFL